MLKITSLKVYRGCVSCHAGLFNKQDLKRIGSTVSFGISNDLLTTCCKRHQ